MILLSFISLLLFTYPSSPALFMLFGPQSGAMYIIYCILGIIVAHQYRSRSNQIVKHPPLLYFISTLCVLLVCSLLKTSNWVAIRDIICLIFLLKLMDLDPKKFEEFYGYILSALTILLTLCLILNLMYVFNLIDRTAWRVTQLDFVSVTNPIYLRHVGRMDFDFSLLAYLNVIPYDSFDLRFPTLFIEPTYTGAYLIAPFLVLLLFQRSGFKFLSVFILGCAILIAKSTMLYVALAIGLYFCVFGIFFKKKWAIFSSLLGLGLLILFLTFINLETLIGLLPGDKITEFNQFISKGAFFSDTTYWSPLGVPESDLDVSNFGTEIIIYRYGVLVYIVYLMMVFWAFAQAFKLLADERHSKGVRCISFLSVIVPLIFQFKLPQLVSVFPLLSLKYVESIQGRLLRNLNG